MGDVIDSTGETDLPLLQRMFSDVKDGTLLMDHRVLAVTISTPNEPTLDKSSFSPESTYEEPLGPEPPIQAPTVLEPNYSTVSLSSFSVSHPLFESAFTFSATTFDDTDTTFSSTIF